jgi:hypothetical protein
MCGVSTERRVGAAATLSETDRRNLAVQALTRSATISDLAVHHGTSRKFVYQQTYKAGAAADEEVLFALTVTKTWLCQVIVGLAKQRDRHRRDIPGR